MSSGRDFATRLLAWWDQNGRKDLPWQHPRTAYRVWISEIMLQQTQVRTVIPYFNRWLDDFPDISTLANASLDQVLSHWAGLGYYARARNLHRCAQVCRDENGGQLPSTADGLVNLPGIGLSTANAIISQSSDQPAAVLDGNVRRVLARHAMIEGWTGSSAVQKNLWRLAEDRLPDRRGADYTQAIMDLGAMVCTRSRPECTACPVADDCKAFQAGVINQYPAPKPKTRISERRFHMLLALESGEPQKPHRILLEKRPPAGIWGGLWSLPEAATRGQLAEATGLNLENADPLDPIVHHLSHRRLLIQPLLVRDVIVQQVKSGAGQRWFTADEVSGLGLPQPVAALLQKLENEIQAGDN